MIAGAAQPLPWIATLVCLAGCSSTRTEVAAGSIDDNQIADASQDAVTLGLDSGPAASDGGPAANDVGGLPDQPSGTPDTTAGDDTGPPVDATVCQPTGQAGEVWVPEPGDFAFRDQQTGSLWNVRGQAFDGPCAGHQLTQIPGFTAFWFSWSISRHGGTIWNREEINQPGEIEADPSGLCNVPCSELRSGGPPPDGIPALDHLGRWDRPFAARMVEPDDPEASYLSDSSIVLGVQMEGEARAYPHAILNWHENHIDQIGAVEYNMTYCPLTGSALLIPVDQGHPDPTYLYVSGRLFNDNLTMFQRDVDEPSFWNQMLQRAISGPRRGERLSLLPVVETTWLRWQQMHPTTLVASSETGYARSYNRNPYAAIQDEDADTLLPVNPTWERFYPTKSRVLAIDAQDQSRAYAFDEMGAFGDRVVINDELGDTHVLVVYEAVHRMAIPFDRRLNGHTLTFEGTSAP